MTNPTILATYENDLVRAEVFTVGSSKRVRLIDIDTGDILPVIKFFMSIDQAHAFAKRCVAN